MPSSRLPTSLAHSHYPRDSSPEDPSDQVQSTSHSHSTTNGSVRRNLFSAHLSRRPASVSQSNSQSSSSQLNPQNDTQSHQVTNIHHQNHNHSQQMRNPTNPTAITNNSIHAASRQYQHQRSVSTPSLSPSPPRLSPFHNLPPPVTFSQHISPPPMAPTPPRHMIETYDPSISPNRPLSPRSKEALFPNSSIIAINPATGRPVLPYLPVLPSRLRLSDEDGDADGDQDSQAEGDHANHYDHAHGEDHTQGSFGRSTGWQHHPDSASAAQLRADEEAEMEADEERRDRERIERLLREMMARQRARAKGKTIAPDSHTPSSSANRHGTGGRRNDLDDDEENVRVENEAEVEREELMSLITASLRREVAKADDENWMFGDFRAVGSALGRDDGIAGGYE